MPKPPVSVPQRCGSTMTLTNVLAPQVRDLYKGPETALDHDFMCIHAVMPKPPVSVPQRCGSTTTLTNVLAPQVRDLRKGPERTLDHDFMCIHGQYNAQAPLSQSLRDVAAQRH